MSQRISIFTLFWKMKNIDGKELCCKAKSCELCQRVRRNSVCTVYNDSLFLIIILPGQGREMPLLRVGLDLLRPPGGRAVPARGALQRGEPRHGGRGGVTGAGAEVGPQHNLVTAGGLLRSFHS